MLRCYSLYAISLFLLMGLLINSCNGQESTTSTKERITTSLNTPMVIGPKPTFHSGPERDTNLVGQYIRSIFQDSRGHYWFGPAGQSVARYDGSTLRYFERSEFFQGNVHLEQGEFISVHAITEDQAGNIWFGTEVGLVKYDGINFKSYTEKDGLSTIQVGRKCILTDKKGNIWVGTKAGIFRYNSSADTFSMFQLVPSVIIKDIMEDQTGKLWFATQEEGLFCYDGIAVVNIKDKEGLGDNYAGGMAQDKSGNYWFTVKNGICRYNGKTFTEFTTENGLGGSEIWGLFIEEPSGIIWITARGSTTRFDPSLSSSDPTAFKVFTPEDGLNCCVQSMYQDRLGNMWWGAGQGLFRFDGERFYQVKQNGPW